MILQIKLSIPQSAFIKDPQETKLGISILEKSIELIDEIGFESFTFKKLATTIGSTEASVYRYFENKHQLLLYLFGWYWAWMAYRIKIETAHITDVESKLFKAFSILISIVKNDEEFPFVNEQKLKQIIEQEGIKSILTKNIDSINKIGAFNNYKAVVATLSEWIKELAPEFEYPNMLVTTVIEGANIQHVFSDHLPKLTNNSGEKDPVEYFFFQLIKSFLSKK